MKVEILIVEDSDPKFDDFLDVMARRQKHEFNVVRVRTVVEAEDQIERQLWSLLILDISMNISPGSLGPMRGGHADLGGLTIVEHMYLMEIDIPTIIVTGFDYFQSLLPGQEQAEMLGFKDIERLARSKIRDNLIGCIRYGHPDWASQFERCLNQVLK